MNETRLYTGMELAEYISCIHCMVHKNPFWYTSVLTSKQKEIMFFLIVYLHYDMLKVL